MITLPDSNLSTSTDSSHVEKSSILEIDHLNNQKVSSHADLPPIREVRSSSRSLALEIAGAAIFSALSIALSFTIEFIPRIPGWYIAIIDPISIVWLCAFFLFGFRTGIMTVIIGSIGLIPFDPTIFIGPSMKFLSTIWFVLIPSLYIRIKFHRWPTGSDLRNLRNLLPSGLIAWIFRCGFMILANILVLLYVIPILDTLNLSWMNLPSITGIQAVIVTVFLINTLQTVVDLIVPYLLIFSTGLYGRFQLY